MTEDPLKKVNQELYESDSEIDKRKVEPSPFDPENFSGDSTFIFRGKSRWERMTAGWKDWQKLALIIGVVLINTIIAGAIIWVTVVKFKRGAFSEKRVELNWIGPSQIKGAELVKYKLRYYNNNRIALQNVELKIDYPRNFLPEKNFQFKYQGKTSALLYIGDLKAHQKGEIEIQGRFYAPENYEAYLTAFLNYYPKNFHSQFKAKKQYVVSVAKSPLEIHIMSPKEVLNHGQIEYEIHCKNTSQISFKDIYIKTDYPDGFTFQGAEPYPIQKENIWYFSSLPSKKEVIIKIKGSLQGTTDEIKTLNISVGKLNEGKSGFLAYSISQKTTRITAAPLYVEQLVDDQKEINTHLGDKIKYTLKYGNNSQVGLRDVVIVLQLNTKIVDWGSLWLKNGALDVQKKTITWRASDIPELANLPAGAQREINFELPIKNHLDINSSQDKNFVIEGTAKIDSPDLHIETYQLPNTLTVSNNLVVKLTSRVILGEQGFYNDAEIENFGPLPPEVGKETTYAIHWKITNVSNEIKDVVVKTHLPTGVSWKGIVKPDSERSRISFNERTHEIVWKIPYLENGKGILDFPQEVIFQIGVIPQINQVNKKLTLIDKVILEAEDTFTHEIIHEELKAKDSSLTEDISIPSSAYRVINTN